MEEVNIKQRIRDYKRCLYCDEPLKNKINAKYCSPSCKVQAYKQRKKLKEIEKNKEEAKEKEAYNKRTEQAKSFDRYIHNLERRGF